MTTFLVKKSWIESNDKRFYVFDKCQLSLLGRVAVKTVELK